MTETPLADTSLPLDSFEEFNRAMGSEGATSPYPGFVTARSKGPIHDGNGQFAGWQERAQDGAMQIYTAYTYEAVHAILGDGDAFSSAG